MLKVRHGGFDSSWINVYYCYWCIFSLTLRLRRRYGEFVVIRYNFLQQSAVSFGSKTDPQYSNEIVFEVVSNTQGNSVRLLGWQIFHETSFQIINIHSISGENRALVLPCH
jgi:hypothetical protein